MYLSYLYYKFQVDLVSKCKEFSDVKLRVNEKRALNLLNKDKNKETIRYKSNLVDNSSRASNVFRSVSSD